MKLDQLSLGECMIHDLPRGASDEKPILTGAPARLDAALRRYFRDKLTTSLRTRGVDVVANPDADATVRCAVTAILRSPSGLAEQSRSIATHLAAVQNSLNPAGLLTVIATRLADRRAVVIMKLEREQGVRFDIDRSSGNATVNLELLRQLTLTNKTRVFKTALLTVADLDDPLSVAGRVSDNQRSSTEGRGVADFFLGTFLGCVLALNPAHTTKQFVNAVSEFVNSAELSAETRGRYAMALLTELHSNTIDVVPREFVAEHVAPEHRALLLDRLRAAGVDPGTGFQKDTSLVRYDKIRIEFASGLVLVGAGQDMQNHVRIRGDDEPPGAEIDDVVRTIRGR